MYYKLEENERIMLNKIREITLANYDIERDYIKSEDIFNILKEYRHSLKEIDEVLSDLVLVFRKNKKLN